MSAGRGLGASLLVAGGLAVAVMWAMARMPHRVVDFQVSGIGGRSAAGVAVVPKGAEKLPAVIYLHGSGDSLERSTGALRQFAELGMAAVCVDYTQTNAAAFAMEFEGLISWLSGQPWADTNRVAWVGFSLGAQRMLSQLWSQPSAPPHFLVRLGGGLVTGLTNSTPSLSGRAWLVHGEHDETFRPSEAEEVKNRLLAAGMSVELTVLPGQPHAFGENRALVHRLVAERCQRELSARRKEPSP